MKFIGSLVLTMLLGYAAGAQNRIEAGIGAGTSHPVLGSAFESAASEGNGQNYWLGYGFSKNWGVELGMDQFDFDGVNSQHKVYGLAGVYRFAAERRIHPIAKLGLSSVESKSATDAKTNSFGAKAAMGLEADFRYISVGVLANYHYIANSDKTADYKHTQLVVPAVFLSVHNTLSTALSASKSTAPQAVAAGAAQAERGDADNDGILDQDDKCPQTPAGVVVNTIGCAEKEKASVRLNIEFASGRADILPKHAAEIRQLADFMQKFQETTVEIAGHTDSRGSEKTNTALSQKRADAVKDALVEAGVDANRLTAKGYGPAQPIADNKTQAGRDQNRRVTAEISVTTDKKK